MVHILLHNYSRAIKMKQVLEILKWKYKYSFSKANHPTLSFNRDGSVPLHLLQKQADGEHATLPGQKGLLCNIFKEKIK